MILNSILADTRAALPARMAAMPPSALWERIEELPPPRDFAAALRRPGVSIIAEIKRASPSKGVLNPDLAPDKLAVAYAEAGAAAISVLTEEHHFGGRLADLGATRRALDAAGFACPLLRKDFVIDPYQLLEARAWGADAVLLIAAALDDETLATLLDGTLELGLWPLVEVHNQAELARVLPLSPPVIGINNRNLYDFTVDLETTRRLRPQAPLGSVVVSESGIHSPDQVRVLKAIKVDAALIGEALVTAADPAGMLRALCEAGR